MTTLHAFTAKPNPQLYVWRDKTANDSANLAYSVNSSGQDEHQFWLFPLNLDHQIHQELHAKLHWEGEWEKDEFNRDMDRFDEYRFSDEAWIVDGTSRVLYQNPWNATVQRVRIHLISQKKYRGGSLLLWLPGSQAREIKVSTNETEGCYFDVDLKDMEQHFFNFKFKDPSGKDEPDFANRLWCAPDGNEIWVHSESTQISSARPEKKKLTVHFRQPDNAQREYQLHLWQEGSDFIVDVNGALKADNWVEFESLIYTNLPYRFMFKEQDDNPAWEHEEAKRTIVISDAKEVWTFAGDHELFFTPPLLDRKIIIHVAAKPPNSSLDETKLRLTAWINRGGVLLAQNLKSDASGVWTLDTYAEVVTSFRFSSENESECIDRHYVKILEGEAKEKELFIVLDRADPLPKAPPLNLFQDPPFAIERPGVWVREGQMRFALHAPRASLVEVIGDFTDWMNTPLAMYSTRDGSYWWTQIPIKDVRNKLGKDFHGSRYKFCLNGVFLRQDPAADWVENSCAESASRLVNHENYSWSDTAWKRPGWEYYIIYQIHPRRFSERNGVICSPPLYQKNDQGSLYPLAYALREIKESDGYLRHLHTNAVLLMPVNEFAMDHSWGYNPSFFYSVESSYGGPDALKALVDTCHTNNCAVILDVVFNHAAASDNVLWSIAHESFFDGDTDWGAMINFDHPQVKHFFEKNLSHFMENYHIDGFRFDFTSVILHGNENGAAHVRQAGSGGGWQFLHKLREEVHRVDANCLLIAENLPNEWNLTRCGGPMDSQWCDAFHDKLVEACRGWQVMSQLADALKLTHTSTDQWYEATNYPESHDEVGNVNDRIVNVAGYGQGFRRNKVAAAITLFSRGIPMWFMGAESGEHRQFCQGDQYPLPLNDYLQDQARSKVRAWWNRLCDFRRGNNSIQGPAPLEVHFANPDEQLLAFSRGNSQDFFVVLNFGPWSGWRRLGDLNLPEGAFTEILNSTWPAFAVENEDEHTNGSSWARLDRNQWLNIPEYGAVILQRV